jgi:hypothetical protein
MANLSGLTQNFFPTASETYANNLSASISALAATVAVNSANEYADGDVATLTVDAGTANEATFTGVKASSPARFTNCVWTEGNLGVGHASGAPVIDYDSATHMSQVSKGILVEHKQNGQHRNINADSIQVNGSIIATGDLTEAGVTARTFRTETMADVLVSGGIWSLAAGLNGQMTALTAYITGYRSTVLAIASRAFTASKDTYVDILRTTVGATTTFTLVYTEVANGAAAPALAANSMRLAKVITSGAAITSVLQVGLDSLNNRYRPLVFDPVNTTHLRYESAGANPLSNGIVVPYGNKIYDQRGEWSTVNNRFTCTVPGLYRITSRNWWGSAGAGGTEIAEFFVRVNGSNYAASERMEGSGNANRLIRPIVTVTRWLDTGDYIDILSGVTHNSRDLVGGTATFIEIDRIA